MASGFIRRMLKTSHKVQVWNRDSEKAKALEAEGAVACPAAASACDSVLNSCLTSKLPIGILEEGWNAG
jgi:3-hydroxyisobutyrate dehydrogenase-like beta-hydroxyacid dehydrogenase